MTSRNQATPTCSEPKPKLLLELPTDLIFQIMSYLNLKSLYSFSSANRYTRILCHKRIICQQFQHCECSMEIKYDCRCDPSNIESVYDWSESEDDSESDSSRYSEYTYWGCCPECSNDPQCELLSSIVEVFETLVLL